MLAITSGYAVTVRNANVTDMWYSDTEARREIKTYSVYCAKNTSEYATVWADEQMVVTIPDNKHHTSFTGELYVNVDFYPYVRYTGDATTYRGWKSISADNYVTDLLSEARIYPSNVSHIFSGFPTGCGIPTTPEGLTGNLSYDFINCTFRFFSVSYYSPSLYTVTLRNESVYDEDNQSSYYAYTDANNSYVSRAFLVNGIFRDGYDSCYSQSDSRKNQFVATGTLRGPFPTVVQKNVISRHSVPCNWLMKTVSRSCSVGSIESLSFPLNFC